MTITWQQLAYVVGGGAAGTVARFVVANLLPNDRYPWGTTAVNLGGALLFGLLWGAFDVNGVSKAWFLLLLTGFMGAFTTFSTWVFEVVRRAEEGFFTTSLLHVVVHLVFGVALLSLGLTIGRLVRLGAG